MSITICPVSESFAAEIGDVDLSKPLDGGDLDAIKEAFWKYAVLVFPDQQMDQEQHLAFAAHFGPLETSISVLRKDHKLRIQEKLADVSNLNHESRLWGEKSRQRLFQLANRLWHTDSSFKHLPSLCSLLYAHSIVPIGGRTEFTDMRAAHDALPEDLRGKLGGLVAEHAIANSRARIEFTDFNEEDHQSLPPVPQVMERTIPESGRMSLYLASHAGRIFGMGEAEGRALIDRLLQHATQRQFIYSHRWRLHDLVMWDNRCTMHRQTEFDDLRWERDMQRATVSDIANTCEQQGIEAVAQPA